jgi:maleate isomerase
MTDTIGWRRVFGVVTPSTNTVVQPEYDDLRPAGVTNHISRMYIPDDPVHSDADFNELIRRIDASLEDAVTSVLTCRPHHLILGISAESIWGGGTEPSRRIAERVRAKAGDLPLTQAADAIPAALSAYGGCKRIGLLTPYFPVAHAHLETFFHELDCEVTRAVHLECGSPTGIAQTSIATLANALRRIDGPDVDAIVQFGANLPMARLAAEAERWLNKPVIAVNAATYWFALRSSGIRDKIEGSGRLFAEF